MQQPTDDKTPIPPPTAVEPHGVPTGRAMHVIYVFAIAAVVMGLYFSIRYGSNEEGTPPIRSLAETPVDDVTSDVRPSMAYAQVRDGNLGPNAQWRSVLPEQPTVERLWEHVRAVTEQDKREALSIMSSRRAYHGAPPTPPHAVDPIEHISCVSCHGPNGMRLGNEVVASPMPHAFYASCTQCHVPQKTLALDEGRWLENSFAGLPEPITGERAWDGAPPTIPHATNMRANCISCHGPNGESGLQSSHPWRTSCTQCHGPSGRLDQQPGASDRLDLFLKHNLPIAPDE